MFLLFFITTGGGWVTPYNGTLVAGECVLDQLLPIETVHLQLEVSSKHETFTQCCFNVGPASKQWPNIKTTLGERLVFAG